MPLNFGSATTSAFYVGTSTVSAIYQGSTQVWPTAAPGGGITYVGTGGVAETGAVTTSTPYPSGIAAGDFLFAVTGGQLATPTDPSGWTRVLVASGTDFTFGAWYKIATGSESGTLGIATGSASTSAMNAWRGVNATTPLDTAISSVQTTSGLTTIVVPALTTVTAGAVPVWAGSGANPARSFTSTGNERTDGGATQKAIFTYDDAAVSTAGTSTGTRTVTISAANRMWAMMMLLRPA